MPSYSVLLRSDEPATPRRLRYSAEAQVARYEIIVVSGMQVLVDAVTDVDGAAVFECRRLWKLRLRDTRHDPVGVGFIVNEQRHVGTVETLILQAGGAVSGTSGRSRVARGVRRCARGGASSARLGWRGARALRPGGAEARALGFRSLLWLRMHSWRLVDIVKAAGWHELKGLKGRQ
ncbi:MAG: hypothetical protein OXG37_01555 [Actinomycetia bacterium]|nr:hypothetical protein [Actinomycetes bacterium]